MNPFLIPGILVLFYVATKHNAIAAKVESEVMTVKTDDWTKFDALFQKYAGANGIPWQMVKAICMNESSLGKAASVARGLSDPHDKDGSVSSDGKSWGLMQLTLPTANDYESVDYSALNNPETSIRIACEFLGDLWQQFSGQMEWVVKSYNQGAGNSRKEQRGDIDGYAGVYWERFQSHYSTVLERQG